MENYEIAKFEDGDFSLDVSVSPKEETVWLTKDQMALLFGRDRTVISKHVKNIFAEGELVEERVCAKNARTGSDGKTYQVDFYNLDVVISVGYRVKSPRGTMFRKWANGVLKQYLLKGFALSEKRLLVPESSFVQLENDVSEVKKEISSIKERMFLEPVKERLFCEGEYFDAYEFLCSLVMKAKESLLLIDPYFDLKGLRVLEKAQAKATIVCSRKAKLSKTDIEEYERQYHEVKVIQSESFHDRFLILDKGEGYSLGASLNGMGKRVFSVHRIEDPKIVEYLLDRVEKEKSADAKAEEAVKNEGL